MTTSHTSFPAGKAIFWAIAIFLLALAVRLLGASSNPVHIDELYHLLAGRSWAEDGTFRMLDGEYLRGRGFTMLVGLTFELFGRADLYIARLPSVLAGALLTSALFWWLNREAGRTAAWIGALLFCFASYAIVYAQFTRFYSLQALLIWLAAILIYRVLSMSDFKQAVWRIAVAGLALAFAMHMQVTTIVAVIALAVWAVLDLSAQPRFRQRLNQLWGDRRMRYAVLLALVVLPAAAFALSGDLVHQFRHTPKWAEPDRSNFLYYFLEFFFTMPVVWLFLPLASVVALAGWPRPALFCLIMMTIPLVVHSFGGMKSSRYVFYAMPFMFAIWGMAVASWLPALRRKVGEGVLALQQATGSRFPVRVANGLGGVLLAVIIVCAIIANPIYRTTIKSIKRDAQAALRHPQLLVADPPNPPWSNHVEEVRRAIGQPSVLLVGDDFDALAYLGPYDLLINTHRVVDIPPGGEFVLDPRTGRRAIANPDTIAKVVSCYPDGAIVVADRRWRTYIGISDEAADAIERLARPVEPAIPGFHIFKWQGNKVEASCDSIHGLVTGHRN